MNNHLSAGWSRIDMIRVGILPPSDLDEAIKLIMLGSYKT